MIVENRPRLPSHVVAAIISVLRQRIDSHPPFADDEFSPRSLARCESPLETELFRAIVRRWKLEMEITRRKHVRMSRPREERSVPMGEYVWRNIEITIVLLSMNELFIVTTTFFHTFATTGWWSGWGRASSAPCFTL